MEKHSKSFKYNLNLLLEGNMKKNNSLTRLDEIKVKTYLFFYIMNHEKQLLLLFF